MLEQYFEHYGGREFVLQNIAGTYSGNLIICGDAKCVWQDLEQLGCVDQTGRGKVAKPDHDFMVINKLGETFPGNIAHWYSNEARLLLKFIEARRAEYSKEFDSRFETHSNHRGVKWHWPLGGHGTSGLGACLVGLLLGYDNITLCGLPLDDTAHNGEPHWRRCRFQTAEVAGTKDGGPDSHWERAIKYAFNGKVKSMSGRSKLWIESLSSQPDAQGLLLSQAS